MFIFYKQNFYFLCYISIYIFFHLYFFLLYLFIEGEAEGVDWSQWWTYSGISGARFWGVINPRWELCNSGKRQSPINVDPRNLLYDPNLGPFTVQDTPVSTYNMQVNLHGILNVN